MGGKIEFQVVFDMERMNRADFESNFDLDIKQPRLCDGGYEASLVEEFVPKGPSECAAVDENFLKNNYRKPQNSGSFGQLFVQSQRGNIGNCKPYIIVGFDAPRTSLDVARTREITNAVALNKNLAECTGCKGESAFWKFELDGDRIKNQNNVNLQLHMTYFGTEEQAPVAYFQYNCNFNLAECSGDGDSNNQVNNRVKVNNKVSNKVKANNKGKNHKFRPR